MQRLTDGFINISEFLNQYGKRYEDWLADGGSEYITALVDHTGLAVSSLVDEQAGAIWVSRTIALRVARWADVRIAVHLDDVIWQAAHGVRIPVDPRIAGWFWWDGGED